VRGDSLRDFYAKTLAVLGLGLIAGAGAIMDYWPVGGELPPVPAARLIAPQVAGAPATIPDIPAPVLARASYVAPRLLASTFASDLFAPKLPPRAVEPPPVALATPADFIQIGAESTFDPSWDARVELPELFDVSLPVVDVDLVGAPAPSAGLQDFVSGAIKRTRESLKDARSSLRGALSGMVGAFRKVSPFFVTTPALF